MVDSDRVATFVGIGFPGGLLATVAVAAVSSPAYRWPADPFSAVGRAGDPAAPLLNGGLVLSALIGVAFAAVLARRWSPALGAGYGLVPVGFGVAGLFPSPAPLHEVGAGVALVGAWVLPWLLAWADWQAGNRRGAGVGATLGGVSVLVWLPYDLGVESLQVGYGGAELLVLLSVFVWTTWLTVRLRRVAGPTTIEPGHVDARGA